MCDYTAIAERPGAYEEWMLWLRHMNEWLWALCDAVTRRTGRLAKVVRLDDFAGFSLSKFSGGAWRLARRWSAANKEGAASPDYLYPQLLGGLCAFHAPALAEGAWRVVRPLMPPRAAEKFGMYDVRRAKDAARLEAWIALAHLPQWLGGDAEGAPSWPPPDATARTSASSVLMSATTL